MTILVQQQLRELCDKATPGEWWIDSHGHRLMSMDRIQTIFIADNKAMGPAIRHPETGNLSHWPNDWDATYIVAAQPKVVRGLLDDIERLQAENAELKDGLNRIIRETRLGDVAFGIACEVMGEIGVEQDPEEQRS